MDEKLALTVQLIADAIERFGVDIQPAGMTGRFRDSLTHNDAVTFLWFMKDGSTHIVKRT